MLNIPFTMVNTLGNVINAQLDGYSQAQVIALTLGTILTYQAVSKLRTLWRERYTIHPKRDALDFLALNALKTPFIGNWLQTKIDSEVASTLKGFKKEIAKDREGLTLSNALSETPSLPPEIYAEFQTINQHHAHHKLSGAVYMDPPPELIDLQARVYKLTAYTNPLHAHWPMLSAMEAQIISWCQKLFGGVSGDPGIITHGGTSSIIEAINIYVQQKRHEGCTTPEIIVPDTAHAAFLKGARITGARLIIVPTDKKTGQVDPRLLESFITKKTAMIVGSAPSFMNGVCDDIEALGKIALKHKVPFHVDSCLGGFITAFDEDKEKKLKLDFRVPGVTSISADTHKYGFAPKGSSVLLFSKNYKPSTDLEWPGGLYVTKNHLDGSRSGFQIAGLYATLKYFGSRFYQQSTTEILTLSDTIREGVKKIDGIYTRGESHHMVIGLASDTLNIHVICDQMKEKGWSLSRLQNPDGFHLCVTRVHATHEGFAEEFLAQLAESVKYAENHPLEKEKGEAKAYGKLKKGVPSFVQDQIGAGYAHLLNTVGLIDDEKDKSISQVLNTEGKPMFLEPDEHGEKLTSERKEKTGEPTI